MLISKMFCKLVSGCENPAIAVVAENEHHQSQLLALIERSMGGRCKVGSRIPFIWLVSTDLKDLERPLQHGAYPCNMAEFHLRLEHEWQSACANQPTKGDAHHPPPPQKKKKKKNERTK